MPSLTVAWDRPVLEDHIIGLTQAFLFINLTEAMDAERHYAVRIKLGYEVHEFRGIQTAPKQGALEPCLSQKKRPATGGPVSD
jgi:hypothetical protein